MRQSLSAKAKWLVLLLDLTLCLLLNFMLQEARYRGSNALKIHIQPQQMGNLLLMLVTSLVTCCSGMAFHSSTIICGKSADTVVLVSLT